VSLNDPNAFQVERQTQRTRHHRHKSAFSQATDTNLDRGALADIGRTKEI